MGFAVFCINKFSAILFLQDILAINPLMDGVNLMTAAHMEGIQAPHYAEDVLKDSARGYCRDNVVRTTIACITKYFSSAYFLSWCLLLHT